MVPPPSHAKRIGGGFFFFTFRQYLANYHLPRTQKRAGGVFFSRFDIITASLTCQSWPETFFTCRHLDPSSFTLGIGMGSRNPRVYVRFCLVRPAGLAGLPKVQTLLEIGSIAFKPIPFHDIAAHNRAL